MLDAVHKGHIYKFDNGHIDGFRYVLVVGSEHRAADKMVSILMLGDTGIGHDVVKLSVPEHKIPFFVHCGMVTYTRREFLLEEVCEIPEEKMNKIERIMANELDLLAGVVEKARFYENAYNEVLDKLVEVSNKE